MVFVFRSAWFAKCEICEFIAVIRWTSLSHLSQISLQIERLIKETCWKFIFCDLGRSDPHTRTLFSYRKYKFCLIISGAYNFRSQSHINKSDNRSKQNTHEFLRNLIWECVRRLHLQKSIQMHFDWTCIAVCKLIVSIVSCYVIYTSHILLIQLYRLQRDTVYVFTNALTVIYLEFKLHCFFSHYY